MLKIERNKLLAPYTTLKIGPQAEFFAKIKTKEDLQEAILWAKKNQREILILGGGSNILITKKLKALVLKNEIKGSRIITETKTYALVEGKSGEAWTKFVNYTIEHNLYGLENLFLIYGTVGGAPIQNIGAYGVELKDIFYSLEAINLKTGQEKTFLLKDCHFSYRDSIFKNSLQGKYFIYSLTVKLKKTASLKIEYGSIRAELAAKNIKKPSLRELVTIITKIRNSKIPNPGLWPNAGSFFKNIEISSGQFKKLLKKYPEIPHYSTSSKKIKIPSAWLIEQVGWKGKRIGPVGMSANQALILINYKQANSRQVLNYIKKLKAAVRKKFALDLQEEVNII